MEDRLAVGDDGLSGELALTQKLSDCNERLSLCEMLALWIVLGSTPQHWFLIFVGLPTFAAYLGVALSLDFERALPLAIMALLAVLWQAGQAFGAPIQRMVSGASSAVSCLVVNKLELRRYGGVLLLVCSASAPVALAIWVAVRDVSLLVPFFG
eukprot:RCo049383